MSIKKLGNGKFFIRVKVMIKKKSKESKYTGAFPTMGLARAKEQELLSELKSIKSKLENEELRYTWRKALNDYFEESQYTLRLSTLYNRVKSLEAHTSSFYDLELETIKRDNFQELFSSLNMSVQTKREVLKYCRQVFEFAIDGRRTTHNPLSRFRLHEDKNKAEKAKKLQAMTQDEIVKLLDYTKNINFDWYSIFFVTYQLGLRSSEVVALEFEDIDWDRNHVNITKTWIRKTKSFGPPKNGTSRIVPMNNSTAIFLKQLALRNNNKGFVLPRISKWINGGITQILHPIQESLGIKLTNYHSLRASFITHLLRGGMDIIRVQAMVGHAELKTTQRYIRLDATDLKGATDFINIDSKKKEIGEILQFKKDKSSN